MFFFSKREKSLFIISIESMNVIRNWRKFDYKRILLAGPRSSKYNYAFMQILFVLCVCAPASIWRRYKTVSERGFMSNALYAYYALRPYSYQSTRNIMKTYKRER